MSGAAERARFAELDKLLAPDAEALAAEMMRTTAMTPTEPAPHPYEGYVLAPGEHLVQWCATSTPELAFALVLGADGVRRVVEVRARGAQADARRVLEDVGTPLVWSDRRGLVYVRVGSGAYAYRDGVESVLCGAVSAHSHLRLAYAAAGRYLAVYDTDGRHSAVTLHCTQADRPDLTLGPYLGFVRVEGAGDTLAIQVDQADGTVVYVLDVHRPDPLPRWRGLDRAVYDLAIVAGHLLMTCGTPMRQWLVDIDLVGGTTTQTPLPDAQRATLDPNPDESTVDIVTEPADRPPVTLHYRLPAGPLRVPAAGYRCTPYRALTMCLPARDGTLLPATVLGRSSTLENLPAPALMIVYGVYGRPLALTHLAWREPLLDRGVLFVAAHVRGGGDCGPAWHHAARGTRKVVARDDLLDITRGLVRAGIVASRSTVVRSGSAGAAIAAAAVAAAPPEYAGAILNNPFLDIERGLLDRADPLAATDLPEWGDPRDRHQRAAIRQWTPADPPADATHFPPVLVTCVAADELAPPWHAVEYVERVRAAGAPRVYLDGDSATSHFGEPDDERALRLTARFFAFTLYCLRWST